MEGHGEADSICFSSILESFKSTTSPTMKALSHDTSTRASTSSSSQPKNDQELGNVTGQNITTFFQNMPCEIDSTLVRMVLAEAIGTFVLIFCIGGIVANLRFMGVEGGLMEYAATAGLTIVIIVFSIGSISGAHVNPAVTIAFAIVGPFPWSKVPLYILAQVGGSVSATYTGRLVYGIEPALMVTRPLHGLKAAFLVEFIATFIILFLTTSLFNEPESLGHLSGFVAGVAICLGVLISGPVSGGSMNPARSLGPALVSWRFDHLWIYLVAPTIGAIAGVFMYRILRLQGWSCKDDTSERSTEASQSPLI